MAKLKEIKKNVPTRFDRNVVDNLREINKYTDHSSNDNRLIKSLLVYISKSFQEDLFGFRELDPDDFAETMSLDVSNLKRKSKNPKYLEVNAKRKKELVAEFEKHGPMSEYRLWDSNLENALFICTQPILRQYKTSTDSGTKIVLDANQIIESLEIILRPIGKTKKLFYGIKLTQNYKKSLEKFFTNINPSTFSTLRRSNLEDAYLVLTKRINDLSRAHQNVLEISFVELSELLEVKYHKDDLDNSKKIKSIKQKLKRKAEKLTAAMQSEVTGLRFRWDKGHNQKYSYKPVFSWYKMSTNELKEKEKENYENLFRNVFLKNLIRLYQETYGRTIMSSNKDYVLFLQWFFDSSVNSDEKESYYVTSYNETRGNIPNISAQARKYFKELEAKGKALKEKQRITINKDLHIVFKVEGSNNVLFKSFEQFVAFLDNDFKRRSR